MKELLFRLEDRTTGNILIDEFPPDAFLIASRELSTDGNKKIIISGKKAKAARFSKEKYLVYCLTYDQDLINSNRRMKSEAEVMLAAALNIENEIQRARDRAESQTKRLIHNLKSLTAKTSHEIFCIALQTKLMGPQQESLSYLEKQVTEKPKEAAKAILAILKHNTAQNTEFAAFHKLSGDIGLLKREPHKIHKILMSVFYLFFQDFTDKGVVANVNQCELQGVFDYDSIHVCIYHLVENAAKYVKPGGHLEVSIAKSSNDLIIKFDMDSLLIHDEEVGEIFKEGISGKFSIEEELHGNGIGLYLAKRMAKMNNGNLVVANGKSLKSDPKYARNIFTLSLPAE